MLSELFPVKKPGTCPSEEDKLIDSVMSGQRSVDDRTDEREEDRDCDVMCIDDADCEGRKKCCGLCGSRCVDPVGKSFLYT